jgi:hypothetical protein
MCAVFLLLEKLFRTCKFRTNILHCLLTNRLEPVRSFAQPLCDSGSEAWRLEFNHVTVVALLEQSSLTFTGDLFSH